MEDRPRKLGRPRGPRFIKYQITLDEESGEWGKSQPEGLSALLRRLLKSERVRLENSESTDPADKELSRSLLPPIGK